MKITCIIVINVFLMIRFGQCQIDPGDENSIKEDSLTIPKKDSLVLKYEYSPYNLTDSVRTGRIFRKNPGQQPGSGYERFNDDMIVIEPRPFRYNMPNANVAVPGVHYHLKIKGIQKPNRYPRGKFR